jgi:hypothetical protein
MGSTFLKGGMFGESASEKLNIVWDYWGYGNVAVEGQSK